MYYRKKRGSKSMKSFCLIIFTLSFILIHMGSGRAQNTVDTVDMEKVIKFYNTKCAMCHGKKGEGAPRMAKMIKVPEKLLVLKKEELKKMSNTVLLELLMDCKNKMPGYRKYLSAHEAEKLIEYMRSFNK